MKRRDAKRLCIAATIWASALSGCCTISFRPMPEPIPASPNAAVNGAWQSWAGEIPDHLLFPLGNALYLATQIPFSPGVQPHCPLLRFDLTDGSRTAANLPSCTRTVLEMSYPASLGATFYAVSLASGVVVTRDAGRTWSPSVLQGGIPTPLLRQFSAFPRKSLPPLVLAVGDTAFISQDEGRTWLIPSWASDLAQVPMPNGQFVLLEDDVLAWKEGIAEFAVHTGQAFSPWKPVKVLNGEIHHLSAAPHGTSLDVMTHDRTTKEVSLCRLTKDSLGRWRIERCLAVLKQPALSRPILARFSDSMYAVLLNGRVLRIDIATNEIAEISPPHEEDEAVFGFAVASDVTIVAMLRKKGSDPSVFRVVRSNDQGMKWE